MTVLTEQPVADPAEERRGGELPDWDNTLPGEPLPDYGDGDTDPRFTLDDDDCGVNDRDAVPLACSCGLPGCGGD